MVNNTMSIVILAAGKGTRMNCSLPKVLHMISGKPMIQHIIDTSKIIGVRNIHLVYNKDIEEFKKKVNDNKINWIFQNEPLGTGQAMQLASSFFSNEENILVLYGDVPLISHVTLKYLRDNTPKHGIGLLTAILKKPSGYGRIIRNNNKIINIIEENDATLEQLKINEVNTGILNANGGDLKRWLVKLTNNNSKKEYYLTDIISLAHQEGCIINGIHPKYNSEIYGINNHLQLAKTEKFFQKKQIKNLLLSGVKLYDPSRFDLRGTLQYGCDVEIDVNVIIEGLVILGNRVKIGTGCIIKNTIIGDDSAINPYTIIEDSNIGDKCTVGPFARLRIGSKLEQASHIGNFVEIKKTTLGKFSKAAHLSYLGDAKIGNDVNIGAGTITCNYDGANKLNTIIGDDVFIGSGTQLIAPLTIVSGTTIAAGTTVMKDITDANLVYNHKKQNNKSGWKRPYKKK